jgi:hypothetical protein
VKTASNDNRESVKSISENLNDSVKTIND